jgi:hypothetical protein
VKTVFLPQDTTNKKVDRMSMLPAYLKEEKGSGRKGGITPYPVINLLLVPVVLRLWKSVYVNGLLEEKYPVVRMWKVTCKSVQYFH